MTSGWLEELLPHAPASSRTKLLWVTFFILFPLAYAAGIALEMAQESPAQIESSRDRAELIRTAEAFASSKGFSVGGWHQYAITESHADLHSYYAKADKLDLRAVSLLAPEHEATVLFRSGDQNHEVRVYLSLSGQVIGYNIGRAGGEVHSNFNLGVLQVNSDTTNESSRDTDPASEKHAAAEAIVRRALAGNAALTSVLPPLGQPTVSTDDKDPLRTNLEWDASPAGRKELIFHITTSVRDSQLVEERVEAHVDKAFAKANLKEGTKLAVFSNVLYGFFLTFGTVYAIYRYAKRTLQKEVSHVRTLIVAGIFFVSYSTLIYSIGADQLAIRIGGESFVRVELIALVSSAFALSIMGLLIGVGYGSGEGELREAYPGKLTSLDALLAGKIWSQNVAASVLFGVAAAGWLLLCHHSLGHFLRVDVEELRKDALSYTFARLPWLTLVVGRQYDSLLIAVAGLLLPASFLLRGRVKHKRRFAWVVIFALLAVLHDAANFPTVETTLVAMAILASALLLPFFAFDLLAAMVSLSALTFVDELTRLCAVFPSWKNFALTLAILSVLVVLVAARVALRGRRVIEEQVRPLYAKNLAERMSMQAEILAAREAQLRLLPQAAPVLPGIEFAACCLPARGLGGDFYDFFRLDAHRVGIFVAQGGNEGLASALCIALAKGVLMYASQQALSPVEIILELEASFAELLEGGRVDGISFAYGVLDTRRNLLNYARVGASPRLVVYRKGSSLTAAQPLERLADQPQRLKNAAPLHEGAAHIQTGDHLIFFTRGVTVLRARRFGRRGDQWVETLMQELDGKQSDALQLSLANALSKHQRQATDDLTAVVIRVTGTVAAVQEGAA